MGRLRYLKDPNTGKRLSRLTPQSAWTVSEVPHLRIIDDEVWEAAKQRQAAMRCVVQEGIERARRPKYLFSGLTVCASCDAGFTLSSRSNLRCFNHTEPGTCGNGRVITRQEVEGRVLRAIQEKFFAPGVFQTYCDAYVEETNRIRRERRARLANAPKEIAVIERRQKELLNLLLNGLGDIEVFKGEVRQLENRKNELMVLLASAKSKPPLPALHPHMAVGFRERVERLGAVLEQEDEVQREQARNVAYRSAAMTCDGLSPINDEFLVFSGNFLTRQRSRSFRKPLKTRHSLIKARHPVEAPERQDYATPFVPTADGPRVSTGLFL